MGSQIINIQCHNALVSAAGRTCLGQQGVLQVHHRAQRQGRAEFGVTRGMRAHCRVSSSTPPACTISKHSAVVAVAEPQRRLDSFSLAFSSRARLRVRAHSWERSSPIVRADASKGGTPMAGSKGLRPPSPPERARSSTITRAAAVEASELPPERYGTQTQRHISLYAALGIVLLHLLGFTMLGPMLPALAGHFSLSNQHIGYLTSAYPLGMIFALSVWPQLSDRVGRRPMLALSLAGVGVGFIAQGVAVAKGWPFWVFISMRVLSGAMAGASPVLKAYIADIATEEEMPKFMAWREAAATLAYIVGPVLGGLLFGGSSASLALIIASAGSASVAAALLVAVMLNEAPFKELAADKSKAGPSLPKVDGIESEALACPLGKGYVGIVAVICLTSFLYNFGQANFDAFFAVLAASRFSLEVKQIGLLLTSLAVMSFGVSSYVFSRVQKRFGIVPTCITGLTLVSAGLGCIGLVQSVPLLWGAALMYVVGIPLFAPTVPILLMQCVPPDKRGQVMGIDSAVNTVARILGPIVFGVLYGKFGPEASFLMAAGVVFLAAIVTLVRKYYIAQTC
mmetsp:Transcript_33139/g.72249  ORF Transcript_33139/g.72249 Transcript_33139/m.72249 type:complete len:568 (-) Transcript_33139:494-2197(-)|eukprot:CAMPEP_0118958812 /NCGR_PEP_ID=MMETSP1169-20130426/62813_1 /TAXON_ID=36882 /ORGANISM="Pyramimonas obovata, Strain CCMP722" /LENGTH=567 /DNA_ID=CAMNT_0006906939 /DNA_START=168 /DNA_END=1871 /DNA_ORIENTATION=+